MWETGQHTIAQELDCNSHTITVCAHYISPGNILATGKTANHNRQAQVSTVQNAACAYHIQVADNKFNIRTLPANHLGPMMACAADNMGFDNPIKRTCSRTVQGILMSATLMLMQGLHNCSNLQKRDCIAITRPRLSIRMQASIFGASKVLGTKLHTERSI